MNIKTPPLETLCDPPAGGEQLELLKPAAKALFAAFPI
jgi:hypothetical protein